VEDIQTEERGGRRKAPCVLSVAVAVTVTVTCLCALLNTQYVFVFFYECQGSYASVGFAEDRIEQPSKWVRHKLDEISGVGSGAGKMSVGGTESGRKQRNQSEDECPL
jgi:hypothetical protein